MVNNTYKETLDSATLLYSKREIVTALNTQAAKLHKHFKDKNPVCLVVMNGGVVFAGQLFTLLEFPLEVDYCHATRYGSETSGREIEWKVPPPLHIKGRHVLILDDIYDEGHTMKAITAKCQQMGASSIGVAVLLNKIHNRKVKFHCDNYFCELECADEYVFGFGLDYNKHFRNCDSLYFLKQ